MSQFESERPRHFILKEKVMRTLINYLRSCFCKHEFNLLKETECYYNAEDKLPAYRRQTYMCPKCGYVKKIKL